MSEHSPIPWVADGPVIEHFDAPMEPDIAICACDVVYDLPLDGDEARANAAFIVKATAYHDRLVEALRLAERAMHAYLTNPGIGDAHDRAIGRAKEARQGASALLAEIMEASR